jgi:hypothetical protein
MNVPYSWLREFLPKLPEPEAVREVLDSLGLAVEEVRRLPAPPEGVVFGRVLKVEEIPSVWNEKMEEYLGIRPKGDRDGALQDIHWAHGSFGYFPSYMLGNLYAAQIFHAMKRDVDFDTAVEDGRF